MREQTGWLTPAIAVGTAAGLVLSTTRSWMGPEPNESFTAALAPVVICVLVGLNTGWLVAVAGVRLVAAALMATLVLCWAWRPPGADAGMPAATLAALIAGYACSIWIVRLGRPSPADMEDSALRESTGRTIDRAGAVWVVLPTYNEAENIGLLLGELRVVLPQAILLVVDDGSPDGTAAIVSGVARNDSLVRLLVRHGERGLDGALLAGFRTALRGGAEVIVTMDADRSHDAVDVTRLAARLRPNPSSEGADLVIGSRYVTDGEIRGWPYRRRLLSAAANTFARWALGLDQRDCTSGFRAYRSEALASIIDRIPAHVGYAIEELLLFQIWHAGLTICEVPIQFRDRNSGESKLRMREAWHGAHALWRAIAESPSPQ